MFAPRQFLGRRSTKFTSFAGPSIPPFSGLAEEKQTYGISATLQAVDGAQFGFQMLFASPNVVFLVDLVDVLFMFGVFFCGVSQPQLRSLRSRRAAKFASQRKLTMDV